MSGAASGLWPTCAEAPKPTILLRALPNSAANDRDRNAALPPIAVLISAVDHLEIQVSKVIRFRAIFQKTTWSCLAPPTGAGDAVSSPRGWGKNYKLVSQLIRGFEHAWEMVVGGVAMLDAVFTALMRAVLNESRVVDVPTREVQKKRLVALNTFESSPGGEMHVDLGTAGRPALRAPGVSPPGAGTSCRREGAARAAGSRPAGRRGTAVLPGGLGSAWVSGRAVDQGRAGRLWQLAGKVMDLEHWIYGRLRGAHPSTWREESRSCGSTPTLAAEFLTAGG